jgi:hypothetical protein
MKDNKERGKRRENKEERTYCERIKSRGWFIQEENTRIAQKVSCCREERKE